MNEHAKRADAGQGTIIVPLQALEGLHSGILKVSGNGQITCANGRLCEIAGVKSCDGLNIRDLLDDENFAVVADHHKKRLHDSVADRYNVYLTRPADHSRVPVEITAFPEADNTGLIVGSIAIVRDLSEEEAAESIQESVETQREWQKMFEGVAAAVKKVVPFDWFSLSLCSDDGMHVRQLYSLADVPLPSWGVRWYKMPPIMLRLMNSREILVIPNMKEYLSKPGLASLLEDPTTQVFFRLGYLSCLFCPLTQEGKIVANITLYHRRAGAFTECHKSIMKALPLGRAVTMAMFHLQREDLELRLGLIKDIAGGDARIDRVATLLVTRLKAYYHWDNISMFSVDDHDRKFELIDESFDEPAYSFGKGYSQRADEGVLGYAFEKRVPVRSGNVHEDARLQGRLENKLKGRTISELTIPVIVDGKVCALLNSQDKRENAYSQEEQNALELVLGEVATLYRRVQLEQTLIAILDSARDAVIRTDSDGVISWVNPSATRLLGCPENQLVHHSLAEFLADQSLAKYFLKADSVPNTQLTFTLKDGTTRSLLVSGSSLPKEVGGRVYIGSDLSLQRRVEQFENLRDLYHEIALQSQVPLSLCFSWLRRLSKQGGAEVLDTLTKVIEQMKKAQLTFDRLSMFERVGSTIPFNPVLLRFHYILSGVLAEMPDWEAQRIVEEVPRDLPPIRGDLFQLAFCLKSTLAYLGRFQPPEGKIHVSAQFSEGEVLVLVRGVAPALPSGSAGAYADQQWSSHALLELALGRETLKQLLANHCGSFEGPERAGDEVTFRLKVPAAIGDTAQ